MAYRDPVVELAIAALEKDGPSELTGRYMNGAPESYQQVELPLCYLYRDSTDVEPISNMEDETRHNMVAVVVYDRTQDLGEAYDMITGNSGLSELVEKRADDTLELERDTILYQIRRGQQVGPNAWMGILGPVNIDYGVGVDKNIGDSFSVQASLRFLIVQHNETPGNF